MRFTSPRARIWTSLTALACSLPIAFAQNPPPPSQPDSEKIEPVKTSITVSGTLSAEAPVSLEVVDRRTIEQAPGVNIDDRLRNVPGFTLFRRSSSLVANPTTQGVSLRGLGSSGASRSLVLWDSIPLNDPFGGWIYWTRLAPDDIERVEVLRGGSTSIFGDRSLAGSIGLFSRAAQRWHLRVSDEAGNRNTNELGAAFSQVFRALNQDWAVSARTRFFTTNGYFIVPEANRGFIDTEAGVRFATGAVTVDWLGHNQRFSTKLDVLAEDRANGTVLQRNSTSIGTLSAQYSRDWSKDGITILGYRTQEEFHASFSSVPGGRRTEALTSLQQVPSEASGAAGYWRHAQGAFTTLAGADFEYVDGNSNERLFPTGFRTGGGTRLTHGLFGQAQIRTGRWSWFGGARHTFTGDDRFFSPSGGLAVGLGIFRLRG
ncbi:MAG: TonB-dependent receptor, partial [Bryobacteraceae bacterium]